jgi:HipA-like protein
MKRLLKAFEAIRDELQSWGTRLPDATQGKGTHVRVFIALDEGKQQVVGDLSQEDGDFVFRYSPSYRSLPDANPLPAFPDLAEEYRARKLFPFFAVRLPPTEREDVKHALRRRGIASSDQLRILGSLAKRGIANPYEFELAEQR